MNSGTGWNRWSSSSDHNRHSHHRHNVSSTAVNEDDIAMAALLGEANVRSEELRRVASTAGRDGGGRRGRVGGCGREGRGRERGEDSAPGHYGHDNNNNNNRRVVEDVDDSSGKNNDYDNMKRRRRRRWNDRGDEGSTANINSTDDNAAENPAIDNPNKVKANFALSGALATDTTTGNARDGITLKFSEPPEARVPNTRWRLYVFRKKEGGTITDGNNDFIDTYHISKQSSYLFGRERKVADIPVDHSSLSKQHAVLQYRALPSKEDRAGMMMSDAPKLQCRPYLMDLESTNGTFINGDRLDSARYYELKRGDVITFGASTREYVLLTENSFKMGI